MTRAFALLTAIAAYLFFFATFLYLIAFTGNLPVVTKTVDLPPGTGGAMRWALDAGLIALFGVQHSVMARQGFKRGWTQIVPQPVEPSAYVALASLMLVLLFAFWQPIPGMIWQFDGWMALLLWALFAAGWGIVLISTFLINHFELFGVAQAWRYATRKAAAPPEFRTPLFYRAVRHPLYAGFFLAFWATPAMSYGHALLAIGMSAYMLIAIRFEENDLVRVFGHQYESYRRRVGMLLPRIGHRN